MSFIAGVGGGQKRALNPQPWSSGRAASIPNHWAISTNPFYFFDSIFIYLRIPRSISCSSSFCNSSLPTHFHVFPLLPAQSPSCPPLLFLLLLALPSSPVYVFSFFWVWDMLWHMMNRPGVTWLKRSEVLFPRSSQIPIAPKLGVELCLVWASTVFVHVVTVSLWVHKCICLLCMENSWSYLWFLQSSVLLHRSLSLEGRDVV